MADKALAEGSADEMIERISAHMAAAAKERFAKVVEAKTNKDKSVGAGREFVEANVRYMHHVEGIHTAIVSPGSRHADAGPGTSAHKD